MDPIRPIGPIERDLEPIVRVTRSSPDAQRERREREDQPPRRREAPPGEPPPHPSDDENGPSLIDIKV
jgi:hypothetical protein